LFQKIKEKLGGRDFYRQLLVLVLPIIIQQGVTNFVSLVDNVMVGSLGTEELPGVAIVNQLLFVFNLTVFGGLSGASIFGAQFYGKGDHKGVQYAFRYKIVFSVLLTMLCTALMLTQGDALIGMFLSESDSGGDLALTLQEAEKYLLWMLLGLVPFAVSQSYSSTLREAGETVSPMAASILAIGVNVTLNYALIFGRLGFDPMGVKGAAIATVISRYAEMLFLIIYTAVRRSHFSFLRGALRSLYVPWNVLKKILITGSPLVLNELLWSLAYTMINQNYSTRGLTVVAATNITGTASNMFSVLMFAMGAAASILVGQQLGAGRISEAQTTGDRLLFFTVLLHGAVAVVVAALSGVIPLMYNTEPEVRMLTTGLLLVSAAALPIRAYAHLTYFIIRSGGRTVITFMLDCMFAWLVPFPVSFVLCRYTAVPVAFVFFCVQFLDLIKVWIGRKLFVSGIWARNVVNERKRA
jgi:putative MATE family efflux protein